MKEKTLTDELKGINMGMNILIGLVIINIILALFKLYVLIEEIMK